MKPKILWTFIYALCDPATGEPRYVGQSASPYRRARHHHYKKTRAQAWLKALPCLPAVKILCKCHADNGAKWENHWINLLRREGLNILNKCKGSRLTPVQGSAVYCVESRQIFASYNQAGRAHGVSGSTIRNRIKDGRRELYTGLRFRVLTTEQARAMNELSIESKKSAKRIAIARKAGKAPKKPRKSKK